MATEEETLETENFAASGADTVTQIGTDSAILERFSTALERFRRELLSQIEARVEARLQASRAGGIGGSADTGALKELITGILSATLFESGMLNKLIERKLEEMRQSLFSEFLAQARKELSAFVQKEVATALGSENMKILIDEKFRAISIYLKTDVIPKTVAQLLKASKKPG